MTEALGSARQRALVWTAVLLGPLGWFAGFGVLFWLTSVSCQQGDRFGLGLAATLTAALVGTAAVIAVHMMSQVESGARTLHFLLRLAAWGNAIYLLVVALMAVPIGMLSPCPV
jgi:hypothetical protein